MASLRVAVVGAGAAGLCAARHLLARGDRFAPPVVFELSADVGGTWCYQERVGQDVRSSMYKNLRTNLPKEVMMFPDFPFDRQLGSFLSHQEVQRYLEDYCRHYNIRPHIRFSHTVEEVKPVVRTTDGDKERRQNTWEVTARDGKGARMVDVFDAVFVCSGHYSEPNVPDVPGLGSFKGRVLHSHAYRSAEAFSSLSVVVLGAKASGVDISLELAKVGARVTLSHRGPPLSSRFPPEIRQSGPLTGVEDDGRLRFQDGSSCGADVLLFCTGYKFSFPFLDGAQLGVEIDEQLVKRGRSRGGEAERVFTVRPLSGPVRAGDAGGNGDAAVPRPDGGGGAERSAEEGGRRRGAAPSAGVGRRPMGLPGLTGRRRGFGPAGACRARPVRRGVAAEGSSPRRLPPTRLPAAWRHPLAGTGPPPHDHILIRSGVVASAPFLELFFFPSSMVFILNKNNYLIQTFNIKGVTRAAVALSQNDPRSLRPVVTGASPARK
ncbi:uncharacterized protein LOC130906676 isoform X2 [Corythoichthys intestinalis]|uniref:uncharacterized protein LOC130906676 isoform X2 n=1 Tax=Corythoichthys intestinalis TaxID=161448 RepID=UPI0025A58A80|nr:uncharacterized protein LOC130906676 isoform X2 [Corythoichthys intestinalis]